MVEDGTHRNPAGIVVPAMVVSWLLLSFRILQGTPPGAVRDRAAPTAARASRRPLCRHGPPCRHSMMEGGTHCNDAGNVVFATLVNWLYWRYNHLQGTPPGAVRDRAVPTAARASRRPLCTRTTQMRGVHQQARSDGTK